MQPIQRNPQLDDIISYIDPQDGKRRPAIVTQVNSAESVNLMFVNAGGTGGTRTSVSRGADAGNWDFVAYA